jgi:hypothetical protein
MTQPPNNPTLDELRAEFEQHDVRGWLWPWLADVLSVYVRARLATRYRASLYSPSGEWDADGVADLVSEFIVERGIKRGAVLAALQRAESTVGCASYLERSLHRFAISERVRTVAGNIYTRLRGVLDDDAVLRRLAGGGSRPAYGLHAWADEPPPVADDSDLRGADRHLPGDVEWVEYTTGERQSPGIAADDLRRIARALVEGTGKLITADQIMRIIEARYGLRRDVAAAVNVQAASDVAAEGAGPLQELVAEDLARRALGKLTGRQKDILCLMTGEHPPLSVRDIAARLNLSKSLVSKEQQAIAAVARQLRVTERAEQGQVLAALSRLLEESA